MPELLPNDRPALLLEHDAEVPADTPAGTRIYRKQQPAS